MYIVAPNIMINPLHVEEIEYSEDQLILNAAGKGRTVALVKMASGAKHKIDNTMCSDVEEAVRQLVWQIDVANGMMMKNTKTRNEKCDEAIDDLVDKAIDEVLDEETTKPTDINKNKGKK